MESVFDELELVMEIDTSSKSSHGYEPNKMMLMMQRFDLSKKDKPVKTPISKTQ